MERRLLPAESGGGGGSGSGIGIFGSAPGTGAYDNIVEGNYMEGNSRGVHDPCPAPPRAVKTSAATR